MTDHELCKSNVFADKHIVYAFLNLLTLGLSGMLTAFVNNHLLIYRSISVPYAYQCCAFVGCDSLTGSSEENDPKNSAGGNAAVSLFLVTLIVCFIDIKATKNREKE